MTGNLTGPELFADAASHINDIVNGETGDPRFGETDDSMLYATIAAARSTQALTAAVVMLAGIQAEAHGIRDRELEAWQETIPGAPLTECKGKETRRPECAERHTEDCTYADPVPEPPHPSPPRPVKQEPTGPRVYVQSQRGKQGYLLQSKRQEDGFLVAQVQWLSPGAQPVWVDVRMLTMIAPEDVNRCENGQDGENCAEIDPCEMCQQDADREGDEIEESMGLR